MSESRQTTAIFTALIAETDSYIPGDEKEKFVYGGYGQLMASISPAFGLNDPFIRYSLYTALHTAKLGLESIYIACALMYYPFLIKNISEKQIESQYEKHGSFIVSTLKSLVTLGTWFESYLPWTENNFDSDKKLGQSPSDSREKERRQTKKQKKRARDQNIALDTMAFLAIAHNPETAILKLLQRLYILADLADFPIELDLHQPIAQHTIDDFAPVAEALGVWLIKSQLEDAAFKILQPEIYRAIAEDLQERLEKRHARIERAVQKITQALTTEGLTAIVKGRPKHIYGIYKKIQTGKSISEINDVLGVRVIVETEEECYATLDVLKRTFPIAEGIYEKGKWYRDWISRPKPNGYQSIHTTIVFEDRLLEIQIRTQLMHDLAEYGAAAHWVYRKTGNASEQQKKYLARIAQVSKFRRLFEINAQ